MSRTMLIHKQLYQQFNLHCIISSDTGTGALAEMGEGALDWCTIRDGEGALAEMGEGALDWCTIRDWGWCTGRDGGGCIGLVHHQR